MVQEKTNPRLDSAGSKPAARPDFASKGVGRVLTWLGLLAFAVGLAFFGKFFVQQLWK